MERRLVFVVLLGGLVSGALQAAEEVGEIDYFAELPKVLTPSRMPQTLSRAPAAMTVIEADLIHATGYRDLPRILRLVPGMQLGQERSGSHWVTYHGLGNDNPSEMQVLVDGRSALSPSAFGGVDWATLPVSLEEIERIEIVRGTDAVAYGTNAFLGVVNIITRPTTGGSGSQAAAVAKGNAGITDLHADWTRSSDTRGLRLAADLQRDDGFEGLNDSSRQSTFSIRSDWLVNGQDELTLRLGAAAARRGSGYPDSLFGNNAERDTRQRQANLHLQWRHEVDEGEEWRVSLCHVDDRITDEWTAGAVRADLSPPRPAVVPLNRNRESTRHSLEIQNSRVLDEQVQMVWGGELRRDTLTAPFFFYMQPRQESDLSRLFGNLEWQPTPQWSFHAGSLAEHYAGDRSRLAPRLFANWQASPTDTLRAGYSRGWRHRNVFELYGDIRAIDPADGRVLARPYLPNPDLRPTRIDSTELGYLTRFSVWRTSFDLRVFNERISDFIVRETQPATPDNPLLAGFIPSSRYTNLGGPVTLRGLEYQVQSNPMPDTRVLFSHALIDRRAADPSLAQRTAPYTASLTWLQQWGAAWKSTLTLLRMGPLAGGDGFVPGFHYTAKAYTTADARIAWHTHWAGFPAELALVATNLGSRHQEIADRSEQFLHPERAVNPVSRMVWLRAVISSH